MLFTPVFKGYHDKAYGFGDGQDKGKDPDGDNFNGSNQGNPNSLNTTPGGNCSVPGKGKKRMREGRKKEGGAKINLL